MTVFETSVILFSVNRFQVDLPIHSQNIDKYQPSLITLVNITHSSSMGFRTFPADCSTVYMYDTAGVLTANKILKNNCKYNKLL